MGRALFVFFALLPVVACGPAARASDRPNILWLVAEDFGPELGGYGTPQVWSPNLDRLAAQGVRYTRAYTTAPVCSASARPCSTFARASVSSPARSASGGSSGLRERVPVARAVLVRQDQLLQVRAL